jgi:2-amino-4-hydroxy-6-hydroxymethyldihydropteridine diphosphokinase
MREPVTAYIGLGANLGDPARCVLEAVERIAELPHTQVLRRSSLYRTTPVGAGGPDYVNAVVEVSTRLAATDLLSRLQAIETAYGRERPYRNAPRTLDLDLLLYGDARIESAVLQVPHPRMMERAFVLAPLAEIAPGRVPPDRLAAVEGQGVTRLPDEANSR